MDHCHAFVCGGIFCAFPPWTKRSCAIDSRRKHLLKIYKFLFANPIEYFIVALTLIFVCFVFPLIYSFVECEFIYLFFYVQEISIALSNWIVIYHVIHTLGDHRLGRSFGQIHRRMEHKQSQSKHRHQNSTTVQWYQLMICPNCLSALIVSIYASFRRYIASTSHMLRVIFCHILIFDAVVNKEIL